MRSKHLVCGLLLVAGTVLAASPASAQGNRRGRREDKAPKVGVEAPDFELTTVTVSDTARKDLGIKQKEAPKTLKLSAFRDKKPVVLAFGSFT